MKFNTSFSDEQCHKDLHELFGINMVESSRNESKCEELSVHFSTPQPYIMTRSEIVKDIFRREGHIVRQENHVAPHQYELRRAQPLCMVYSTDKIYQSRDEKNDLSRFAIIDSTKDRTMTSSDAPEERQASRTGI
uniref:Uncharacterized protein n=1 Tax=Chaetoceros debilis TaxID=122233 RepID=A0A7S3QJB1_9STRA|mmetsp:Transcript_11379/g.16554  ORF Transcript_11379/g.16554 Transcript_11379/m.16554 type:complete len:135 (+) Transcript_11379:74-478(+)